MLDISLLMEQITQILRDAGKLLLQDTVVVNCHKTANDLLTENDLRTEQYIIDAIRTVFPRVNILSEEHHPDAPLEGITVVIDPIDKPTPTAVPKLAVSYVGYDAKTLGLSFEGPAGWTTDADTAGTFILQNPNARMDYAATLTLRAEKVAADYDTSALKSVVNGMLDSIGASVAWESYDPSQNAGRTLLGKDGIYANYSGILATGEHVAGRVHAVCVGKMLYTIHLTAPQSQWNDYKDMVYDKVRDTLTIVK